MHTVVADSDHSGKQIVNVDLTQVPPASLHPDVLSREVSVLDALADVDTTTVAPVTGDVLAWDGVAWKPKPVSANSYYREAFTVSAVPQVLTVVHNLAVDVVSVTVIRRGSPNIVVTPQISAIDVNTVEVAIEGGPVGDYEVLVLSEGGSGGGAAPAGDYLPLTGGTLTGALTVAAGGLTVNGAYVGIPSDGYGVTFAGDARVYKRVGGGLVLRRHADLPVQTESTDGLTRWNLLDTSSVLTGTTSTISWINNWKGTLDIKMNAAMVCIRFLAVTRGVTQDPKTESQMFTLPSGIPAPWGEIWQNVTIREGDWDTFPGSGMVNVRMNSQVWFRAGSDGIIADTRYIDGIITYPR